MDRQDDTLDSAEAGETLAFTVDADSAGERLDRYVTARVESMTRSAVKQHITAGHILLNGQPTKAGHPLRAGDRVQVWRPPPQPATLQPEEIPLHIVYEDALVVVVEKPAGMVVHPSAGHPRGTLVNALLARYPDMQVGDGVRPGIVHRLDQDTTGLLVVARNDYAMHALTAQQQARTMHKAYLAVIEGRLKEPAGVIDAPIGRHPTDRLRQAVGAQGREARTHYRVREELGRYTLVEAILETGRTHQIRVHFAAHHRPILGDPLYGPRRPRATFGLTRQFLHAHKLGFVLPLNGEWREFSSPLPPDLAQALAKIRAAV
jgi:23S rRNA pseudouridine1911/1915/1917 synthase